MLSTPAASDDWSGRFLGMTLVGDVVSDEAEIPNAGTDLRPVREASAYIPALPTSDSRPSYDLQPHGSSSLFVEDHEELGILGFGVAIEISPGVQLSGSLSGRRSADGDYSLSSENRQLALTAAFRF